MEDCSIGDDEGSSPWAFKYKSHQVSDAQFHYSMMGTTSVPRQWVAREET